MLSRMKYHHSEVHTIRRCILSDLVTRISPIDKGYLERIPCPL
jgi:hypothetical protein